MSNDIKNPQRREMLSNGAKIIAGATLGAAALATSANAGSKKNIYADPEQYAMPQNGVKFDKSKLGVVIIDPQVDFLSPKGVAWPAVGKSVTENNTVANLLEIFKATHDTNMKTFISPHFYYPSDDHWKFGGPGEHFMHETNMFKRKSPFDMAGFTDSGADFMPEFKPYIFNGKTIVVSPHKMFGSQTNDLKLQLNKFGINQIILCGMSSNLCVESHLRDLQETGFEVAVVKDATAGPILPEGDGYLSALTNYRMLANAVISTKEAVKVIRG